MKDMSGEEETSQFDLQYEEDLCAHMRKNRNQYISKAARKIGKQALAQHIGVVELIQKHMRALAKLELTASKTSTQEKAYLPRSGAFLSEAVAVMETKRDQISVSLATDNLEYKEKLKKEEAKCSELATRSEFLEKQSKVRVRQFIIAQEEDRKQISRDLHDQVAQTLAGINMQLTTLKKTSAQDTETLRRKIEQTQQLVETSVKIVHLFARKLRPTMLDDLGLIPSLRALFKDLSPFKRLEIRFAAYPEVELLSNQYRTVLYRVVQEALTNVVRHARAKTVDVAICRNSGILHLEIADNGKSFQVEKKMSSRSGKHLGLVGMQERVDMIGGNFFISSLKGRGTTISVDIPLLGGNEI